MAIRYKGVGTWAESTSTTVDVTLPTHATGDLLIVRAIRKPYTSPDNITIGTAGWSAAGTGYANGTTANANGAGSMAIKVFYKVATSASETNPTVTWGATAAPGAVVAVVYEKDAWQTWVNPTGVGGVDSTAATTINDTLGTHITVNTDDMIDIFVGWCDDSGTPSAVSMSQPGVTYSVTSDIPATALDTGTSNDLAADGGYALATAGPSTGAATITASFGSSEEHIVWMTRLRVNNQQAYSQANSYIKVINNRVYAQANTQISSSAIAYRAYAQSKVWIKRTYPSGGGTATVIQDDFSTAYNPLGGNPADIGGNWTSLAWGNAYIYTAAGVASAQGGGSSDPVDGVISSTTIVNGYIQANLKASSGSSNTYNGLLIKHDGGPTSDYNAYWIYNDVSNTGFLYRNTGVSQAMLGSFTSSTWHRFEATGLSPTYLKTETRSTENALGTAWMVETSDSTVFNQIENGYVGFINYGDSADYGEFGEGIDDFKAVEYGGTIEGPTFAQAQAKIIKTYTAFAQAGTKIASSIIAIRRTYLADTGSSGTSIDIPIGEIDSKSLLVVSFFADLSGGSPPTISGAGRTWYAATPSYLQNDAEAQIYITTWQTAATSPTQVSLSWSSSNTDYLIQVWEVVNARFSDVYNGEAGASTNNTNFYTTPTVPDIGAAYSRLYLGVVGSVDGTVEYEPELVGNKLETQRINAGSAAGIFYNILNPNEGNWDTLINEGAYSVGISGLAIGEEYAIAYIRLDELPPRVVAQAQAKITTGSVITYRGYGQAQVQIGSFYQTNIMRESGLISYWRLGDVSGLPIDYKGNNTFTSTTGTPTYQSTGVISGDSNKSIAFDYATNEYFTRAYYAGWSLALGDGPLTYEVWIKRATVDNNSHYILSKGYAAPALSINTSYIVHWDAFNYSAVVHSSTTIQDTNWHHIVGTKDTSDNWYLYIDGKDVTVVDNTGISSFDQPNDLKLGSDGTYPFDGSIDEVAIYSAALTPIQVWDHYTIGSIGSLVRVAQAQAKIKSTNNSYAQAQVQIAAGAINIYRGYGQTQAQIKQSYKSYGQSLAEIKQIYRGYAQAQSSIKTAYRGYAQAQSKVKAAYQGYAQAQSTIKAVSQSYAQAQAQIAGAINTYRGYAQALTLIKATTINYAQAQVWIKATYPRGGGGYSTIVRETYSSGGGVPTGTGPYTHTVTYPTGVVANDYLVLNIGFNGGPTGLSLESDGWTLIGSAVGQSNPRTYVYGKKATGSLSGDFTYTTSNTLYTGYILGRYSGVDQSTPLDVTAVGTDGAANTVFSLTGVTTVTNGAMVFVGISCNSSSAARLAIDGGEPVTEYAEVFQSSAIKDTMAADGIKSSAGSTDTITGTISSSLAWAGVVGALRPAAGGAVEGPTFAQAQAQISKSPLNYAQAQTQIKQVYQSYAQAQVQISVAVSVYRVYAQASVAISGSYSSVNDTFTRTVGAGLGTADTGGTYQYYITNSGFSVNGSQGIIAPKDTYYAFLPTVAIKSFIAKFKYSIDQIPTSTGSASINLDILGHLGGDYENLNNIVGRQLGVGISLDKNSYIAPHFINPEYSSGYSPVSYTAGETWLFEGEVLLTSTGALLRAKTWKEGTAEPGWVEEDVSSTLVNYNYTQYKGYVALYPFDNGVITNSPTITIDNLTINETAFSYYGQAQTQIITKYNQYAQAQVFIKAKYGHAQANVAISGTYTSLTDTFTRSVSDGWGTSDTGAEWITYYGSNSVWDTTGSVGTINQTEIGDVVTALPRVATYNCQISFEVAFSALPSTGYYAHSGIGINASTLLIQGSTKRIVAGAWLSDSGNISVEIGAYGTTNNYNSIAYTLNDTYIVKILVVPLISLADIIFKYKLWKKGDTEPAGWLGETTLKEINPSYNINNINVVPNLPGFTLFYSGYSYTNGQVTIDNISIEKAWNTRQGNAQAQITKFIAYSGYAQTQTWIETTYRGYAQSLTQIKQIYRGHAQAQTQIKTTYRDYGQTQAKIKQTYQAYAQASSLIKASYLSYAQANSQIKQTYRGYAQAQAQVKQAYQGYGQSAAQIKQAYRGYAQANTNIKQFYQAYAQAQAQIKQTYQSYAQANATIVINIATYRVYAQAGAHIKVVDNRSYAQSLAQIKTTYRGYAQANTWIEQTYQGYAQSQTTIKAIYRNYAQAQGYIKAFVQNYAQAQGQIKTTYHGYGQAEATIRQAYRGYAQAQAQVKTSYQAYAQAQGQIKTSYTRYAQAQAEIKQTYQVYAQSGATIKTSYLVYAQAQVQMTGIVASCANAQVWIYIPVYLAPISDIATNGWVGVVI